MLGGMVIRDWRIRLYTANSMSQSACDLPKDHMTGQTIWPFLHGLIDLALFISFFVLLGMNALWLIKRTRSRADLAWANNFGGMLQASLVGFAIGGSFGNLELFDGFYVLVIMSSIARRIVVAKLATRCNV